MSDRFSSLQVCRMRVSRLAADGAPAPGADNLFVTDQLISLGYALVVTEGKKYQQDTGCGQTCLTYTGRDKITSVNLTLTLCVLDSELIEMLTGATLVTEGGETVGFAIPEADAELDQEVSIEAWTKAWDFDQQAASGGNALYHRFIFPRTTWVLGDSTLEDNPLVVPVKGKGTGNSQFGDGPANDLPYDAYLSAMGKYTDANPLPAATDGYAVLAAS